MEEAKILLYQGKSAEAIQILTQGWIDRNSGSVDMERFIILSLAEARVGDLQQAKASIAAAESLCHRPTEGMHSSSSCGEVLSAQGSLALEENDLPQAQNLFKQTLDVARNNNDRYLQTCTLLNLGVIDLQEYHYENALKQLQESRDVARQIGANQVLEKAVGNAGWAYYATGDFDRARVSFNDATVSAHDLGSTVDEANWLTTTGMSDVRLGDYPAARERYRRALALAQSLKSPLDIAYANEELAALQLHSADSQSAQPYIHEADRLAHQERSDFDIQLTNLLEAELIAHTGDLPKAKALLQDVEQHTEQFPTTHLEAQHTLAQVCEKSGDKQEAEHWFKQSIATYREQRSQLKTDDARLPFFENGHDLYLDYVAFLVRNHRTDEALEVIDQGRAETLAEGLGYKNKRDSQRPLLLKQLSRQSHAVILVYALSSPSSYLWASNGKQSGFHLLPDRSAILAAAADHQHEILAARDLIAEQRPAARTLYEMLVKPADQLIHPGDRVYIVGAGQLSGLNFETLVTPVPSTHYWIEDVTITHFSSLRFLAAPRHPASRTQAPSDRLLIIGNPVYAGSQYSPLPNAAAEVRGVASHFPSHTVLTGAGASPAAYIRSQPARYSYIHFVSHATASRLVPLDSAVILSGSGSQDSAKLYAREILNQPLNAELVTISACQGSGVRTYAGEGLVGLAWAFMRAGSHNVIGALWDVSDASTPEIMQHLYDGIAAGQPPDVSLRAAKLDLLHRRGVFRKPLYWGAFQLYSSGR